MGETHKIQISKMTEQQVRPFQKDTPTSQSTFLQLHLLTKHSTINGYLMR